MQNPKFEIAKDNKNEFRFNLKAKNGQVILSSSEGYTTRQNANMAIESVKKNVTTPTCWDQRTSANGQFYFVLNAANNKTLGMSEMYTTRAACENGMEAVRRDAPNAPVQDLTLTPQV